MIQMMPNFWLMIYLINMIFFYMFFINNYFLNNMKKL